MKAFDFVLCMYRIVPVIDIIELYSAVSPKSIHTKGIERTIEYSCINGIDQVT